MGRAAHFGKYLALHDTPCAQDEMQRRVLAKWDDDRDDGTTLHADADALIVYGKPMPEGVAYDQLRRYFATLPPTAKWFRTEWRLGCASELLAGTPDAVLMDGDPGLVDWKRCCNIFDVGVSVGKLTGPLAWTGMRATRVNAYGLAMNLYAHMLRQRGVDCGDRMFIVSVHDSQKDFIVIRVLRVDNLVEHLLYARQVELRMASGPPPPMTGVPASLSLDADTRAPHKQTVDFARGGRQVLVADAAEAMRRRVLSRGTDALVKRIKLATGQR